VHGALLPTTIDKRATTEHSRRFFYEHYGSNSYGFAAAYFRKASGRLLAFQSQ
jgi:hypothetical protein